ncbi:MAG: zf-HC2 domain-containing protein [Chloroflexi bacterium]|nr:zf-HC2 domain-containing protein [Chloroflexota bacterium]
MSTHPVSYETLIAFAADELTGGERDRLATHVPYCAECAPIVNRFRLIRAATRTDKSPIPPHATVARAQAIFSDHRASLQSEPSLSSASAPINEHPVLDEELIAFAVGELTDAEQQRIAAHLRQCDSCATEIRRITQIRSILESDDTREPSPQVIRRAQAILAQQKRTQLTRRIETGLDRLFQMSRLSPASALLLLLVANLLVFAGLGIGLTQNAAPGDFLYPIKSGVENLQITMSVSDADKLKLYLDLAGVRVEEIRTQVSSHQFAKIPDTAVAYQDHVQQSSDSLLVVFGKNVSQAKTIAQLMQTRLDQYVDALTTLSNDVPDETKPALLRAIEVSGAAISVALRIISTPVIAPTPRVNPTPTRVNTVTPSSTPRPAPSNTRVIPLPPDSPTVPSSQRKPPSATTVRPPPDSSSRLPTSTSALDAERCPAPVQPRSSGIITKSALASAVREPDGEPINPKDEFRPTDKIYTVLGIVNAPSNTRFKAIWCVTDVGQAMPANAKLGQADLVSSSTRNIEFTLALSRGFPVGRYRVQIYVNDVLDTVKNFSVR